MKDNNIQDVSKNDKSFNIYLSHHHKELLKKESEKRGLTISAFLRTAALEKISREKINQT
jgi:hypothetical protein